MTTDRRPPIELFYDFVCPYAYLAWTQVERIAREAQTEVILKPMLLGGVFRAIGAPDAPAMSEAKARLNELDLQRWSKRLGKPLVRPKDHPRRTVLALRAALGSEDLARATRALFEAYWAEGLDLEDPEVVAGALGRAGLDGRKALERAATSEVKDELRARTEEAVRLGVFGAPTCVVRTATGPELFWGQDRLDFVHHAVTGEPFREAPPETRTAEGVTLHFFFDFSSPYAYLASSQVRALARRTGATLRYRPLLLGALFKAIGTPNVPLFAMPAAKQLYNGVELERWASRWKVPFRFTSHFPMNTVKALRLVLGAPEEKRADLVDALFRAAWAEDRNLADDLVLSQILTASGCDVEALLASSVSDAIKDELRRSTSDAQARGVFGVPSFVACGRDQDLEGGALFWGQDRLELVADAIEDARTK